MNAERGIGPIAYVVAALLAASLAIVPAASAPAGQQGEQPAAPRPAQIDRNGVLVLIRSTLLALHQANETGNYTVLRDLAAPGFREANTAARLGEIFASQRAQKLDLAGVSVLEPQLTLMPQIESNGLLHMTGFFPSAPSQVSFELLFAPVEGRWRPFGIAVNVGSSAPSAPPPGLSQAEVLPARPPTQQSPPAKPAAKPKSPPPQKSGSDKSQPDNL